MPVGPGALTEQVTQVTNADTGVRQMRFSMKVALPLTALSAACCVAQLLCVQCHGLLSGGGEHGSFDSCRVSGAERPGAPASAQWGLVRGKAMGWTWGWRTELRTRLYMYL